MKRSTALKHIEHIAAEATRYAEMEPEAWPLESMWIGDDILDAPDGECGHCPARRRLG